MAKVFIEWHSMKDDKVCPICEFLNGYIWVFQTGENMIGESLNHPQFGEVWNVNLGSKAHGHDDDNCRCSMSSDFDLSDTLYMVKELREHLVYEMRYVGTSGPSLSKAGVDALSKL